MGVAESSAYDGYFDDGLCHNVPDSDSSLFDLSVECTAPLDVFFAIFVLFCGFDREQRRSSEEGVRGEIGFSCRGRSLEYDQLLIVHGSPGLACDSLPLSLSLDVALSHCSASKFGSVHDGVRLFLRHGECFLP